MPACVPACLPWQVRDDSGVGLAAWTANGHHATLLACLPCLQVIGEMRSGLADWEAVKRWDTLGISAQVADGSFNWSCS